MHTTLLPKEITTARLIRKKKPWAVAAAATLLVGACIPTMINAMANAKVNAPEYAEVVQAANDFGNDVRGDQTAFDAQVTRFKNAETGLHTLVDNRRQLGWMELYNAIDVCLPRDPENAIEGLDITERNLISITGVGSERHADLGGWFSGLDPLGRGFLPADVAAPSGPGYIITVQGKHWHHEEDDPSMVEHEYVLNTLVKNLGEWQIEIDGFDVRDVRRMGITHPTLTYVDTRKVRYSPLGFVIEDDEPQFDILEEEGNLEPGQGGQFDMSEMYQENMVNPYGDGSEFASDMYATDQADAELTEEDIEQGVRLINETEFTLQFVYKPVEGERPETDPLAPASPPTTASANTPQ
jgi:type IV pilus assembly protein PilM